MKKNFLAIATLLIAAMLLVVSCAPEAKVEDDGLVNASFSVAYGKDVTVAFNSAVKINYTYSLEPEWNTLTSGVEPFGKQTNQPLATDKGISEPFEKTNLGRVTPGLWKITVEGKIGDKVVMKGSTKAYFRNGNNGNEDKRIDAITSATVYVAPVNNVTKGKLSISIQMEDLGDGNDIGVNAIECKLDGNTSVELTRNATPGKENVYTYSATKNDVTSGYHYITFTVPGYDGGVTKSFLMLPGSASTTGGNDVEITGSVVPSKFATTGASINVINIPDKVITVGSGVGAKEFKGTDPYDPYIATALTVPVSIGTYTKPTDLPEGTRLTDPTYTWYVNGVNDGSYNAETGEITIPNEPGDYTITCIISVTYYDADGLEYTIYGHEKQAAVVRLENKVATTTPSQGN